MLRNRDKLHISCVGCHFKHLCLPDSFGEQEIKAINSVIAHVLSVKKGETIYTQNDSAEYIYAVYSGACKDYWIDPHGEEFIDNFFYPGDLLALESISQPKYTFFASALLDSELCVIPLAALMEVATEYPKVMQRIMAILSAKSRNNTQIKSITNVRARLAGFLYNTFRRYLERSPSLTRLRLPMSQIEIAHHIGVALETVNRTLLQFKTEGVIQLEHKILTVVNLEHLREISGVLELSQLSPDRPVPVVAMAGG